jgi:hypothetical protein
MISVYVKPHSLTIEQYDKVRTGLEVSGANTSSRNHHSCFGDNGRLAVFEIWDSSEDYQAFSEFLLPLLVEADIPLVPPVIRSVVNLDQQRSLA